MFKRSSWKHWAIPHGSRAPRTWANSISLALQGNQLNHASGDMELVRLSVVEQYGTVEPPTAEPLLFQIHIWTQLTLPPQLDGSPYRTWRSTNGATTGSTWSAQHRAQVTAVVLLFQTSEDLVQQWVDVRNLRDRSLLRPVENKLWSWCKMIDVYIWFYCIICIIVSLLMYCVYIKYIYIYTLDVKRLF